jgi:hypothetical protein
MERRPHRRVCGYLAVRRRGEAATSVAAAWVPRVVVVFPEKKIQDAESRTRAAQITVALRGVKAQYGFSAQIGNVAQGKGVR